jgi:phage-related protein
MYKIVLYKTRDGDSPIKTLLDGLDEKAKTSKAARVRLNVILRFLRVLRKSGSRIGMPFVRHIEDDIWELRPDDDRLFYAYWKDNRFVILHQFVKKSKKAPPREIEQAKRNLKDFLERSDEFNGEY